MPDGESMVSPQTFSQQIVDAMIAVLQSATSPEMVQAQALLLRRLALTGDVVPSRIPAPLNITEIGGYINLLETLNQPQMRTQTLASILGVAGPTSGLEWLSAAPALFFATRPNDRPPGPNQAAIPVQYTIRSDFASAFDDAIKTIHDTGCLLPILSSVRALPPISGTTSPPPDLLPYLGRTLDLVPSAALIDPDLDALALAQPGAGGNTEVVARQLDNTALLAGSVMAANWNAWICDSAACTQAASARTYLPVAPILNAAGWYQPVPANPTKLSQPGNWARWTNIAGLVANVTVFGDELQLLYPQTAIASSTLRERLHWIWNGIDFVEP